MQSVQIATARAGRLRGSTRGGRGEPTVECGSGAASTRQGAARGKEGGELFVDDRRGSFRYDRVCKAFQIATATAEIIILSQDFHEEKWRK